jgi:hypothetical protein
MYILWSVHKERGFRMMNSTEQKFYALLCSIEDKLNRLLERKPPEEKKEVKRRTKKSVKKSLG